MRIVITVEEGPAAGRRWLLRPGDRMVFGRTEHSDIMIANDPLMSSCHFRVAVTASGCSVEDLQSTNGTLVNDKRVKTVDIAEGDRILAGSSVFLIKRDSPGAFIPLAKVEEVPEKKFPPLSDEELVGTNKRETWEADEKEPGDLVRSEPKPAAQATESVESAQKPNHIKPTPVISPAPPPKRPSNQPPTPASTSGTIPSDFRVEVRQCGSGAWCATQAATAPIDAGLLLGLLGGSCPIRLIIDFARAGINAPRGTDPRFLPIEVPEQAVEDFSPRMMRAEDVPLIDWMTSGWGTDAVVILFSYVDIEPMLDHFQVLLSSPPPGDESNVGLAGLCRPSVLESWLRSGNSELVAEILDPCEAILLESNGSPGGWALYGNVRMAEFLKSNGVPFAEK